MFNFDLFSFFLKKKAHLYHKPSLKALFVLFTEGVDIPKNRVVSKCYYMIEQGDKVDPILELAKYYKEGKEGLPKSLEDTVKLYKMAVKRFNSYIAMVELAIMYKKGQGCVKQKIGKCYTLLKKSYEESKNEKAAYEFAKILRKGYGVEKDFKKALEIFLEISSTNKKAKIKYAQMLQNGEGVEKDLNRAYEIYKRESKNLNLKAKVLLGDIYLKGCEKIERNPKEAFELFQYASNFDYGKAHYKLGKMYLEGEEGVVEYDYQKAFDNIYKGFHFFWFCYYFNFFCIM